MLSRLMTRKEQLVLLFFGCAIVVGAAALWYSRSGTEEAEMAVVAGPAPATAAVPAPEPLPIGPPLASPPQQQLAAPPPQRPSEWAPEPELPRAPEPPALLGVSAAGEVVRPDVYMLPEGARVRDLVEKAGGATALADLSDINLAARLIDGSTLTIPARRQPGKKTLPAAYVNPPPYTISGWQPPPQEAPAETPPVAGSDVPAAAASAEAPLAPEKTGLIDLNSASQDELESLPGIGPKLAAEIIAYRSRTPFASVDDLTNVSGIGPKKLEGVRNLVTVR
ncbi:MAG: ComEA family DNA-binding protein [Candidatus Hydrogenedentes bacterium]|nr:ComEA family DNA-binding protein [Candidatus Hydrogenedentota bacterium]